MFLLFPIFLTHFLVSPQNILNENYRFFYCSLSACNYSIKCQNCELNKQYFCVSCFIFSAFRRVYEYISLWNSAWASRSYTVPLKKCQYFSPNTYFQNMNNRLIKSSLEHKHDIPPFLTNLDYWLVESPTDSKLHKHLFELSIGAMSRVTVVKITQNWSYVTICVPGITL